MSSQAIFEWITKEWFGILAVVIGVVTSVYFYVISKRERRPCCFFVSNNIVKKAHEMIPGLKLHFAGHGDDLFDFTISKLVFWNKGRETIRKDDVASAEPIKVNTKNGALILSANVLHQSSDANQFRCAVNREKTSATITFDYVDHGQCVVFEIAHSGANDGDIFVTGLIKGAPYGGKLEQINHPQISLNKLFLRWLKAAYAAFLLGVIVPFSFVAWVHADNVRLHNELVDNERTFMSLVYSEISTRQDTEHSPTLAEYAEEILKKPYPRRDQRPFYALAVTTSLASLLCVYRLYSLSRRIVPKEAEAFL